MGDGPLGDRQCAATSKRSGERCRRAAIIGGTVCVVHGGAARQVQRKAAGRAAEARALAVFQSHSLNGDGAPVDVISELADLVREVRRFRDFLGSRVSKLSANEWSYEHPARERITTEIALYERACDRSARLLADVARLGLDDLELRAAGQLATLERARAERITEGFETALSMVELTAGQQTLARRAAAWFMLHLTGQDADD